MDKKVFYGEYTLMHWIELIQSGNIVLPEYQRCFVWDRDQVETFVGSLKKGSFIPPVIIGAFQGQNLIIDGQQRLSTLLLSYLGRMPKPDAFVITDDPTYVDAGEEEGAGDGADVDADVEAIKWTFNLVIENGKKNTKAEILQKIDGEAHDKYEALPADCCLDETFLNKNYLGFSYIVPSSGPGNTRDQVKFYSTVFHDINMQGVELQAQESRRSLYYLDSELTKFFEPQVSSFLKVTQKGRTARYDFVRSLAFASQYAKDGDSRAIAKKCRRQEAFEQYYADFINVVINDENSAVFGQFSSLVGEQNIDERMNRMQAYVDALSFKQVFRTIIAADTKLIGLIYHVVIKGKQLDDARYDALTADLDSKIVEYEGDEGHKRSPNAVTHLRKRINDSIKIYELYLHV